MKYKYCNGENCIKKVKQEDVNKVVFVKMLESLHFIGI